MEFAAPLHGDLVSQLHVLRLESLSQTKNAPTFGKIVGDGLRSKLGNLDPGHQTRQFLQGHGE